MPASSVNLYHMQDAKNNFNAVRPIPVCDESNYYTTPNHNIHISTDCYYGYHELQAAKHVEEFQDCEMKEVNTNEQVMDESPSNCTARKRGADDYTYTQNKRLRKEVQTQNSYEPETKRTRSITRAEDSLLESLYWNIHGGTLFTCYNSCDQQISDIT